MPICASANTTSAEFELSVAAEIGGEHFLKALARARSEGTDLRNGAYYGKFLEVLQRKRDRFGIICSKVFLGKKLYNLHSSSMTYMFDSDEMRKLLFSDLAMDDFFEVVNNRAASKYLMAS